MSLEPTEVVQTSIENGLVFTWTCNTDCLYSQVFSLPNDQNKLSFTIWKWNEICLVHTEPKLTGGKFKLQLLRSAKTPIKEIKLVNDGRHFDWKNCPAGMEAFK